MYTISICICIYRFMLLYIARIFQKMNHPCQFATGAPGAPHQDGLDLRSACRDAPKADLGPAGLGAAIEYTYKNSTVL